MLGFCAPTFLRSDAFGLTLIAEDLQLLISCGQAFQRAGAYPLLLPRHCPLVLQPHRDRILTFQQDTKPLQHGVSMSCVLWVECEHKEVQLQQPEHRLDLWGFGGTMLHQK